MQMHVPKYLTQNGKYRYWVCNLAERVQQLWQENRYNKMSACLAWLAGQWRGTSTHLQDVSAHHQTDVLGDVSSEVHQGGSTVRVASHHKNLWPESQHSYTA